MNALSPVTHTRSRFGIKQHRRHYMLSVLFSLLNTFFCVAHADIITVGRGAGVLWEDANFTEEVNTRNTVQALDPTGGIASVTNTMTACIPASELLIINGVLAYPIAPGIGLVPVASVNGYYINAEGNITHLTGSIGLNGTSGTITGVGNAVIPAGRQWCLTTPDPSFYFGDSAQRVTLSGHWAIVADGTQASGEYALPNMYAGTFSVGNRDTKNIFSSANVLRINTLACTVATSLNVNFGTVSLNTVLNAELASITNTFDVTCNQTPGSSGTNTNINVTFSSRTGLGSTSYELAVNPHGAYITGEISDDVTGSGICGSNTGIRFDGTPIKIGDMPASDTSRDFNHQVTWRLCSEGRDLYPGGIDAATNLDVTYN